MEFWSILAFKITFLEFFEILIGCAVKAAARLTTKTDTTNEAANKIAPLMDVASSSVTTNQTVDENSVLVDESLKPTGGIFSNDKIRGFETLFKSNFF